MADFSFVDTPTSPATRPRRDPARHQPRSPSRLWAFMSAAAATSRCAGERHGRSAVEERAGGHRCCRFARPSPGRRHHRLRHPGALLSHGVRYGAGLALPVPPAGGDVAVPEQAETAALVARMAVPPASARRALIDAVIAGLKADGVWARLDWLCLLAAHDAQAARLNWRSATKALAAVNSPVFMADRGYQGDGAAAYLGLGEWLIAAGNQFAQNDAAFGLRCNMQAGPAGSLLPARQRERQYERQLCQPRHRRPFRRRELSTRQHGDGRLRPIPARRGPGIGRTAAPQRHHVARLGRTACSPSRAARSSTASLPSSGAALLRRGSTYGADRGSAFYSGAGLSDARGESKRSTSGWRPISLHWERNDGHSGPADGRRGGRAPCRAATASWENRLEPRLRRGRALAGQHVLPERVAHDPALAGLREAFAAMARGDAGCGRALAGGNEAG